MKCATCGIELGNNAWVPDDMDSIRRGIVYCYTHAPPDALRVKDLTTPRGDHQAILDGERKGQ